ncbi:hypothetical protein JCM10212_003822 [Sporobolomyces blumeae]
MRASTIFVVSQLVRLAFAFPWMAAPGAEQATHDYLKERGLLKNGGSLEERGLIGSLTGVVGSAGDTIISGVEGGLGDLVNGLSNALATGVKASDRRPDADHPFKAPGPTDQRGPCPGLNTLANHGYLPRSGIVTGSEVIQATSEGFNMAADLSGLLVLIAVAFGGNLETATFSIGGEDERTYSSSGIGSKEYGRQYGLDAHSRCEGDASATRADYFLNNGDNHSGQPARFKRFVELAKKNGGEFNLQAANELYAENAKLSLDENSRLYFQAYTIVVVLGEYPFIPNFFSNGTYASGGVANLESISSIMGYKVNDDGSVCYQPERFPDNWYRRATPYGTADGLIPGLVPTYAAYPLLPNPLQAALKGGDVGQIGCELIQGLRSGIPASLVGSAFEAVQSAIDGLESRFIPGFPKLFGCDISENALQQTDNSTTYDNSMQETGNAGGQKYTCS